MAALLSVCLSVRPPAPAGAAGGPTEAGGCGVLHKPQMRAARDQDKAGPRWQLSHTWEAKEDGSNRCSSRSMQNFGNAAWETAQGFDTSNTGSDSGLTTTQGLRAG